MFTDIQLSKDISNDFKTSLGETSGFEFDFSVQVLTAGCWPLSAVIYNNNIRPDVISAFNFSF